MEEKFGFSFGEGNLSSSKIMKQKFFHQSFQFQIKKLDLDLHSFVLKEVQLLHNCCQVLD